tara:strand:- start:673 stop:1248 length:576 start_codon:yes stop_codon:yes gene_type:complete
MNSTNYSEIDADDITELSREQIDNGGINDNPNTVFEVLLPTGETGWLAGPHGVSVCAITDWLNHIGPLATDRDSAIREGVGEVTLEMEDEGHTMKTETLSPYDIERLYNERIGGHFFDSDTMAFFGDRMTSFDVVTVDGQLYMYRKPTATVSVFGYRKITGCKFFGCWLVTDKYDLDNCDAETKQAVYDAI